MALRLLTYCRGNNYGKQSQVFFVKFIFSAFLGFDKTTMRSCQPKPLLGHLSLGIALPPVACLWLKAKL
jgi:hypothetical protein